MEEMITTKISEALTDLNTKNQTTNAPTSKVDDASSPSSAKKQKLSSGLIDLYNEDEEDIDVTGDDGDDYGDKDVEYFASFFKNSKASSDLKSVYFKSLDLVTLLIATFTNTSRKRQDACKYVLDPRFKSLRNDASASDGLLFGPDFQKLLREVTENSKISPFAPGVLKNSSTLLSRRRGGGRFTRGQSYWRGSQGRTGIHGQLPRLTRTSQIPKQGQCNALRQKSLDLVPRTNLPPTTVEVNVSDKIVSINDACIQLPSLVNTEDNYVAGKLSQHIDEWKRFTSDSWVLEQVVGIKVEFINQTPPPVGKGRLREYCFNRLDRQDLQSAILDLEKFQIVHRVRDTDGQFLSNIMGRRKKDGSMRCILNLSKLNDYIVYDKFKLETLNHAVRLMRPKCWFGSVDIFNAYYAFLLHPPNRLYFWFQFQVAVSPGVEYGVNFYSRLEILRNRALRLSAGQWDSYIPVCSIMREDLSWWIHNVDTVSKAADPHPFTVTIYSGASSEKGWGGECNGRTATGTWNAEELGIHINCKELLAALFCLKSFVKTGGQHVRLFTDNATTVACINRRGSTTRNLNDLMREMCQWCIENDNRVTAIHIPGKDNLVADRESRLDKREIEWQLNKDVFRKLDAMFGPFEIDLFASRLNNQVPKYISWKCDPDAWAVDAM
ncbi:reverse transcriptase/ribonuclease h/methyltransferase [Elysia marginata]|uniref:Reverse transcriptase/ribonuclease h/methyltransferase n=1 Tax=Elysia marginata TaxID=1093978 RepID=A0AAV4GXG3_9GAST|nr:reverse transcriptase/ribonuclease h/methyltransferase [Elysia marginata]